MGYIIDPGQYLFEKTISCIWLTLKMFFRLIAYLPLWLAGYMITTNILEKADSALAWIGLIILFALFIYQIVFFIKGIIIGLMIRQNLFWIPLLLISISFTCVLPVWLVFKTIQPFLYKMEPKSGNILAWLCSIAFGIYVYSRYHYLTNIAPKVASISYQLGLSIISKSLKADTSVQYI